MHPLVSVILPAKNEQGNIGKLIQEIHSALNHIVEFEIIVVDDGSTDNTVQEAISTGKTLMYKNVAAKESRAPIKCGLGCIALSKLWAKYGRIHWCFPCKR
jgi:dolichol-phosphate mannosyltransferase